MNQFFTFMLDWSLKSTVTALLGFACVMLLQRRSAATRHLVWRVTLVAIALLPLAMVLTPKAGAPAVMEPIQAPVRAVIYQIQPMTHAHVLLNPRAAKLASAADHEGTLEEQLAGGVYAIGLLAMFAYWFIGYVKILRMARAAAPVADSESPHHVLLARDSALRVPITFGMVLPVILLPKESVGWPELRVRAAVLHESAHIARKDWTWQTVSNLVRALQWFNPAVWLMNSALQATSETATDDEVLTRFGMGRTTYATELLKVAEEARGSVYTATAMARRNGVSGRLRRIMAEGIDRAQPRRRLAVGLGIAFSAVGILIAAGTVAEAAGADVEGQTARLLHSPVARSLMSLVKASSTEAAPAAYTVKLSHGGLVRLVAMTGWTDDKGPVWRPDGSRATQADKDLLKEIFGHGEIQSQPEGRIVNFYLQVSKLPLKHGETENGIFRIKPNGAWEYQGGSNTFADDGRLQWDRWLAPNNVRTCDMDCAISYGAFVLAEQGKITDEKSSVQIGQTAGDWTTVSVHQPGDINDEEAKLECFDADGNPITGSGEDMWGSGGGANGQHFDFSFKPADAQRIATYKFSIRKYEHVLMKGIKLPPTTTKP